MQRASWSEKEREREREGNMESTRKKSEDVVGAKEGGDWPLRGEKERELEGWRESRCDSKEWRKRKCERERERGREKGSLREKGREDAFGQAAVGVNKAADRTQLVGTDSESAARPHLVDHLLHNLLDGDLDELLHGHLDDLDDLLGHHPIHRDLDHLLLCHDDLVGYRNLSHHHLLDGNLDRDFRANDLGYPYF
jgi:hypothetical protein